MTSTILPVFLPILLGSCGGLDHGEVMEGVRVYQQASRTWQWQDQPLLLEQRVWRHEDPDMVMNLLEIRPGITIANVGCGAGFYLDRFAAAVGEEGRVFCVDIQERALQHARAFLGEEGVDPHGVVEVVHNRVDDLTLPPGSVDLLFMGHLDFYLAEEMMAENVSMLASCRRALAPEGRAVVVQFLETADYDAKVRFMTRNFERAGFQEVRTSVERDVAVMELR